MRKVLHFFLLSFVLPIFGNAQHLLTDISTGFVKADFEIQPPKVLPPVWSDLEKDELIFSWEPIKPTGDAEVMYEFYLTAPSSILYREKTLKTKVRFQPEFLQLESGRTYEVYINTYVTDETKSYVISGKDQRLTFTYVPRCTPPKNPHITSQGSDFFVVSWEGNAAIPKDMEYMIRFRQAGTNSKWSEVRAEQGNSVRISGIEPQTREYEVQIEKLCYWADGSVVPSEWVLVYSPRTASLVSSITCDTSTYGYPSIPCSPALSNPNIDTLYIGGVPIQVKDLSSYTDPDGKVKWSGIGVASLPFGNAPFVQVDWNNVVINANGEICQGTVTGMSDMPENQPDLNQGPIAFGGEICIPPPSSPGFDSNGIHNVTGLPWDPNGFGPDGLYVKQPPYPGYQPGFPLDTTGQYDPNGFDVNGINALTGTPYNPQGCSAEGVDSLGQLCNPNIAPYSWMDPTNGSPPTQAGLEFAASIEDSLNIYIQQILILLSSHTQDSIDNQAYICNGIRSEMTSLLSSINQQLTPDIDPAFLFGEENEYFNAGMHVNFTRRPEPLAKHYLPSERLPEMTELENKHINLYDCDVKQSAFVLSKDILTAFLGADFGELREIIFTRITQQTPAQIRQFIDDHAYFLTWLTDQVKIAAQLKYLERYPGSIGAAGGAEDSYHDVANRTPIYPKEETLEVSRAGGMLAAGDFSDEISGLLLQQSMDVRPEDIAFEYLQGFRMVNGVHRAYYMEAIHAARGRSPQTDANADLMPIVLQNIGSDGRTNRVYLDNIRFRVDQPALADVYVVLDLPGSSGQRIVFESIDALFTPNGLVINPLKLQLADDIYFRLSNVARLKLLAGDSTFVAVDCNGFAGLGIAADVELCRSIVKPYNPVTGAILPEPARVSGHFSTYAPNFTEIMVSFTMDPFVITGVEDVKWLINGVTLDMSETISPIGAPPQGYNTPFASASGFRPLWKGFYIQDIQVSLPNKFTSDNTPVTVVGLLSSDHIKKFLDICAE